MSYNSKVCWLHDFEGGNVCDITYWDVSSWAEKNKPRWLAQQLWLQCPEADSGWLESFCFSWRDWLRHAAICKARDCKPMHSLFLQLFKPMIKCGRQKVTTKLSGLVPSWNASARTCWKNKVANRAKQCPGAVRSMGQRARACPRDPGRSSPPTTSRTEQWAA